MSEVARSRAADAEIVVRSAVEADLEAVGAIAEAIFGDEIAGTPPSLLPTLYRYLARYYWFPKSPFNLATVVDGRLCGALFAAPANLAENADAADAADAWIAPRLTTSEERVFFAKYRAYLDANRRAELAAARPNETLLLFFVSVRPGCGRAASREFERRLRAKVAESSTPANASASSVPLSSLLWTDDTCDFDWYERNGFAEVARFPTQTELRPEPFSTFLFRKEYR